MASGDLEGILDEYRESGEIGFQTLQEWESGLSNPYDLKQLYWEIINNQLHAFGSQRKMLEPGLTGYIMGRDRDSSNQMNQLSTTDSLTGLPNRRGFENLMSRVLERASRNEYEKARKTIALIFLDINRFKKANDTYGHEFGDDILKYVAEALKIHTRPTDGKARLGGDEFVVVLDPFEGYNTSKLLSKLCYNINQHIKEQIKINHHEKESDADVSLGMSVYGRDAKTNEGLMVNADKAMYYAKKNPNDT